LPRSTAAAEADEEEEASFEPLLERSWAGGIKYRVLFLFSFDVWRKIKKWNLCDLDLDLSPP
jgi:hypothetical protein